MFYIFFIHDFTLFSSDLTQNAHKEAPLPNTKINPILATDLNSPRMGTPLRIGSHDQKVRNFFEGGALSLGFTVETP